jgi:nitronate monooxygenase
MTVEQVKNQLSLPVIVAPMFLISTPDFALATCRDGMVGSFPALNAARVTGGLESWLITMNQGIEDLKNAHPNEKIAPYAVNLIIHPEMNPNLKTDLDLCVKYKVPVIITSLGAVPDVVDKIHAYGGIVLHDVTNTHHARKALAAGVDGLIAVSEDAGGHAGTIAGQTLLRDIRQFYNGPLALAGGLSSGADVAAALKAGADFAYMGTRFIATTESAAPQAYKEMLVKAQSSDIIYTSAISGIPGNFLRQSLEDAGLDVRDLIAKGAAAPKLKMSSEAAAWKKIWSAGHGVSDIADIPSLHTLATRLKSEFAAAQATPSPLRQKKNMPKPGDSRPG